MQARRASKVWDENKMATIIDKAVRDNVKPRLDTGTKLSFQRTFISHERTQMAWVRTALSLISFGFTIAKLFEYLQEKEGARGPLLSPRAIGILMISIGLISLALGGLQHRRAMKELRDQCPGLPVSVASVTLALIALLGILALFSAALRQ